jgi:hypothetical protein
MNTLLDKARLVFNVGIMVCEHILRLRIDFLVLGAEKDKRCNKGFLLLVKITKIHRYEDGLPKMDLQRKVSFTGGYYLQLKGESKP